MKECANCGAEVKRLSDRDYCDNCQYAYDVVNILCGDHIVPIGECGCKL